MRIDAPPRNDKDIKFFNLSQIKALPVFADQVQNDTQRDLILHKVIQMQTEWLLVITDELRPYWIRRNELSIECTILGNSCCHILSASTSGEDRATSMTTTLECQSHKTFA